MSEDNIMKDWTDRLDEELGATFDMLDGLGDDPQLDRELEFERGLDILNDLMWDRWRKAHPAIVEPTTGEHRGGSA